MDVCSTWNTSQVFKFWQKSKGCHNINIKSLWLQPPPWPSNPLLLVPRRWATPQRGPDRCPPYHHVICFVTLRRNPWWSRQTSQRSTCRKFPPPDLRESPLYTYVNTENPPTWQKKGSAVWCVLLAEQRTIKVVILPLNVFDIYC